ncbi:MAG TPA: hypothetical protein VMZ33_00090, partial [Candidatus Limnocylindrales bacterium]|nr:hypothetical protein [Candidatus Limnocylindrales bacterium]
RGNTSSDLIEVADQFTDIAQIARVDKSSGRSGRRVAAEGDLSMTEVPEKETEGAPRRRRGGGRTRDEREYGEVAPVAAVPAATAVPASNLVVLPGERLSRAPEGEEGADEGELVAAAADLDPDAVPGESEEARRRRRRRGGRGRGRGRRGETETYGVASNGETAPTVESDDDEEFEELVPSQPPHQTFGSVWDSQIGVPSGPSANTFASFQPTAEGVAGEDEDLDEPEVPEYLLAERRQRGQRPPAGRGGSGGRMQRGNRAAYQVALDRERFGRGAGSAPTPSGFGANSGSSGGNSGSGGGGAGRPDRQDRGRDRNRGRDRYAQGRSQDRAPRNDVQPYNAERSSAEPWSEVPPELEQMLRAELERKTGASGARPSREAPAFEQRAEPASAPTFSGEPEAGQPAETAPAKPARRARTTKAVSTSATPEAPTEEAVPADESGATRKAAAPRKRSTTPTTTRSRTTTKAKATQAASEESAAAEEPAAEAEPKKAAARRRRTTTSATEES